MARLSVENAFRHDRAVVLSAIGVITALAWFYVIWFSTRMEMADAQVEMPGMNMPSLSAWDTTQFSLMLAMWGAMMVGMMLPSVAPMVLIYARVARNASDRGKTFAPTGWFATGYLLSWLGFSVLATVAQWALEQMALLSPMSMTTGERVGGLILLLAGIYQWTAFKETCLSQCQAPLLFIQRHGGFRSTRKGAVALGLRHGLYCIGCCWALMGLLFVFGIMNLLWIAAIAGFVLLEKLVPVPHLASRTAGLALITAGLWLLL